MCVHLCPEDARHIREEDVRSGTEGSKANVDESGGTNILQAEDRKNQSGEINSECGVVSDASRKIHKTHKYQLAMSTRT